jgi:oligosaccharide repeat unit polymerase
MFGITLALIKSPKLRALALFGVVTAWPYFIFARTRNYMLATVLPGAIAWVFLRLRIHFVLKLIVLAAIYSVISAWFSFVMVNRSDVAISSAFSESGFNIQEKSRIHQEGLNMFEELCWINTFLTNGSWDPIWGQEYYTELVNPIPRTWWPGKPLIGIDYAMLRGQGWDEGDAGVGATISTGMMGQGVVNYGQVLGPAFVAFLMSLWVAVLARLDLYGQGVGRLPLYSLGLILTFNLGRDITLLTLYTFVFGALLMWLVERSAGGKVSNARTVPHSQARGKAPVPSGISGGAPLDSSPSHRENPVPLSSSIGSPD